MIFSACHLSYPLFIPLRNHSFCNISCFQRIQQTEAETIYIDIRILNWNHLLRLKRLYIIHWYINRIYNQSIYRLTKNNLPRPISVPWFCASFRPLHALIAKAKALSGDISFTWHWWTWHVQESPTFHEENPYNCYVQPYYWVDDQWEFGSLHIWHSKSHPVFEWLKGNKKTSIWVEDFRKLILRVHSVNYSILHQPDEENQWLSPTINVHKVL